MHGHQQRGGGDQDELKRPQADVRDGEELVIANAVAAGLLGVTGEAGLLIPPNTLCSDHQDQDTEDEDDGEPNASNAGRVPVYAADHGIKGPPVHLRLQPATLFIVLGRAGK
uniref:Uncharacterized protein n=1 Tax=Acanthochromis polyacanthus TaxID=80966 RepID=A0A3Q1GG88_9TELE